MGKNISIANFREILHPSLPSKEITPLLLSPTQWGKLQQSVGQFHEFRCLFLPKITMTQLSVSRALTAHQHHSYLWHPASSLCTLELKVRFCSVSEFSSFHCSKQSRSLGSKILLFLAFFQEGFVISHKAKPLESKLFCFLPFKRFRIASVLDPGTKEVTLNQYEGITCCTWSRGSLLPLNTSRHYTKNFTANFCRAAFTFKRTEQLNMF